MKRAVPKRKPRTPIDVWVGIYKPDDDLITWSTARTRHYCENYLSDVYSDIEICNDIRIVRATLTLTGKPKPK